MHSGQRVKVKSEVTAVSKVSVVLFCQNLAKVVSGVKVLCNLLTKTDFC